MAGCLTPPPACYPAIFLAIGVHFCSSLVLGTFCTQNIRSSTCSWYPSLPGSRSEVSETISCFPASGVFLLFGCLAAPQRRGLLPYFSKQCGADSSPDQTEGDALEALQIDRKVAVEAATQQQSERARCNTLWKSWKKTTKEVLTSTVGE